MESLSWVIWVVTNVIPRVQYGRGRQKSKEGDLVTGTDVGVLPLLEGSQEPRNLSDL